MPVLEHLHLRRLDTDESTAARRLPWMRHLRTLMPTWSDGDATPGRGPIVAVMFPIAPSERIALGNELGPTWRVVDGRSVDRAQAVLTLPCSDQTISAVRRLFPDALLIVIDSTGDMASPQGPVLHALAAGADLYSFNSPVAAA